MRRVLRICGVAIGLLVAIVFGFVAVLATLTPQFSPNGRDPGGIAVFLFIALAGIGLTHLSSRTFFAAASRAAVSAAHTFAGRLQLSEPEGLAFWTLVVCAILLLVPVIPRPLVVLVGVLGYLLASLLFLLIGPRWWYRLGFTLLSGLVLLATLVGIAEALEPKSIGEGGLGIFAFWFDSLFVLPAAVLVRVLVRLVRTGAP
jgi:hypothetical protein